MKLKDIFEDGSTMIFMVTNRNDANQLNWTIKPTKLEVLPRKENIYFVKAKQILKDSITDCYLSVVTPERIAETVIRRNANGETVAENKRYSRQTVIPAVASDCFGVYELYYSKENPQVGIDVLKDGLTKAKRKHIVAEDLGYILRDEGRVSEAIEAFKISEEEGPSSEYIYWELAMLYKALGNEEESLNYKQLFRDNGGIELGTNQRNA